jgi:aryl-alcohol dehydrogenase-like predicted oxidoreductase
MDGHSIKATIARFWLENSGVRLPYGIGCAWLGRGYPDRAEVGQRLATLETTYEMGFRYYDTARAYGNSEWVVGEFVASVPRASIFLATKFNHPHALEKNEAVETVKTFLSESLTRLRTSYLDLYQIHDTFHLATVFEPGGVLDFLCEARRQGLIRHIGMAVREQHILEQALQREAFDTILTWGEFSPFNQDAAVLIRRAAGQGVGVINASPLYDARRKNLDLANPSILAAVIQYPACNPGIDMTLSGPSTTTEIQATLQALHHPLDESLWETWKTP